MTEQQILTAKPGRYYCGQGLVLIVKDKDRRRWAFRYTSPLTKRVTETAIGNAHGTTLKQARAEVWKLRTLLEKGEDPVQTKRQSKVSGTPFGLAADAWISLQAPTWSISQLRNANLRLKQHAAAGLATKIVANIDADAVEAAIKPLWNKAPRQARLTLSMWARVFSYARHKKMCSSNPAEWKGNMEFRFPKLAKGAKQNYPALSYAEVPEFIRRLRIRQARGSAACALEFQILTATRPGETRGAQWDEFDLENRVWTIPAERMKKKDKEHRVPLCDRAMELLALQREYRSNSPYVFTGYNRTQMDEKAGRVLLGNMDARNAKGVRVTAHGFRSSFKSWATEKTEHPWEVIELCLAHSVGTSVAQAYLRGDALEKRRVVMEEWSAFCG